MSKANDGMRGADWAWFALMVGYVLLPLALVVLGIVLAMVDSQRER